MPAPRWYSAGRIAVAMTFASALCVWPSTACASATSADLNVWPFTVDTSTVTAGGTVMARVSVKNRGPAPAAPVTLSFAIGPADSGFTIATTAHLKTVQLGTLPVGGSISVATAVPVPSTWSPGTYRIKTLARSSTPDEWIVNNEQLVSIAVKTPATTTTTAVKTPATTTTTAASPADLKVWPFTVDTSTVTAGGTVMARVSVNNRGPAPAAPVTLSFAIGPADSGFTIATTAHLKTVQLGTLPVGGSISVATAVPVPSTWSPGTYRIKALARSSTPDKWIVNNEQVVPIVVKTPATTTTTAAPTRTTADLNVSAFSISSSTIPAGGAATARASVSNSGPLSADSVRLSFYIGPADSGFTTATTAHLKTVELGTLPARASTSVATTVAVPSSWSPGSYRIKALARSSVPDNGLSNNERLVSTDVTSSTTTIANSSLDLSSTTVSPTSTRTAPTTKVTPLKYKTYLDNRLAANLSTWNNLTATSVGFSSAGGFDVYHSEYILLGALSMFEATQLLAANNLGPVNTSYLETALTWIENWTTRPTYVPLAYGATARQIADASKAKFIIDSNGDKNWSGGIDGWDLSGTGITAPARIAHSLHELQGMVQMARAVRIIKTDAALNAIYGARATAIGDLIEHMITKHLVHHGVETRWFSGYINQNAHDMNDKPMQLISIFVNMHRAGYGEFRPGRTYQDLAKQWLSVILSTKVSSPADNGIAAANAALIDYRKVYWASSCSPLPTPCSWDTAHYNRYPKMLVYAYDAGFAVPLSHIQQTANLLTKIIWDGSIKVPRFTNRIDGNNSTYRTVRTAWQNGGIFDGFASLGRFDATALAAAEATMDCIIANCGSPSVAFYEGDRGRFALAAEVMLARLRFELGE
jgi:Domain of unknown function DUF11